MMSSTGPGQGHGQGHGQGQAQAQGQSQGQGQGPQLPMVFGVAPGSVPGGGSNLVSAHEQATQEHPHQPQPGQQQQPQQEQGQGQAGAAGRPLNVSDALTYLEEVKAQFSTQSDVYVRFLDIMKEFKSLDISTTDVISRVSQLFKDHPRLIMGFNTFLPAGFSIELTNDPNLPVRVITPDGLVNYNSQGTIMPSNSTSSTSGSAPSASVSTVSPTPVSGPTTAAPPTPAGPMPNPPVGRPVQPIQPAATGPVTHPLPPGPVGAPLGHSQSQPMRPLLPSSSHGPMIRPSVPVGQQQARPPDAGLASPHHAHATSSTYLPPIAPPATQQPQPTAGPATAAPPRPFPLPVSQPASSATGPSHGPAAPGSVPPTGHGHPPPSSAQHQPPGMTPLPPPAAPTAMAAPLPPPAAALGGPAVAPSGQSPANAANNGAVDFGQAITYVNKLKNHFHGQPEVYRQFLEILTNYQKETRPVEEVNAKVQDLLKDAPHLIEEFKQFLPLAGPTLAAQARPFGPMAAASHAASARLTPGPPSSAAQPGPHPSAPSSRVPRQTTPSSLPPMGDHFPDGGRGVRPGAGGPNQPPFAQSHSSVPGMANPHGMDTNGSGSKKRKAETSSRGSISTKKKREGSQGLAIPTGGTSGAPGPQTLSGRLVAPCDEMELFDKIKKRIASPVVYAELLKIMTLYAQGALTREQFVERADPFLAQRAPDLFAQLRMLLGLVEGPDGVLQPAPTPNANTILHASPHPQLVLRPEIAHMDPALTPIDGTTIQNLKGNQHTDADNPGPSYRRIRKNVPMGTCSGRDAMCRSVLNDEYISHPPQHSDTNPEDNGGTARRNPYEDAFCKTEEDRYEFDMYVEAIQSSIRLLEPIHHLVQSMRDEERAKFTLPKGLGSRHPTVLEKVVKKLYAEGAPTVMEALHTSPGVAVGLVLRRLKQKDEEWRRLKREFSKVWREADAKNFYKSLDFQGMAMKESARKFQTKSLLQEIETTYNEAKDKRANGTLTAPHHMELRFNDKEVIVDVFELLAGLNETSVQFVKLRPFLEGLLFGDQTEGGVAAGGVSRPPTSGLGAGAGGAGAGALRRRSSRKHIKPASSVTCFGNNNIYLVLRLVHSIYTRLEALKTRADEMARNPHLVRSVNPVAINLGLAEAPAHEANHKHPLEYYPWTLTMLRSLLTGELDAARFEEDMRSMFGTWAHHALFLDKMVQNTLKAVKDTMTDKQTMELIKLFSPITNVTGVNRHHTETHMRLKAEEVLGDVSNSSDHLFRFVLHFTPPHAQGSGSGSGVGGGSGSPSLGSGTVNGVSVAALQLAGSGPRSVTIQMLGPQDFINGDEEKWTEYVEKYTTSVAADPMAEQYQQAVVAAAAATATVATVPFLPRAIRKVAQSVQQRNNGGSAQAADRVLAHDGLQLKICINTYRLFFIALTEDSFARVTAGDKAAADNLEVEKRHARQHKFVEWLNGPQGWNRDATGDVEDVAQRRIAEAKKWLEDAGAMDKKPGDQQPKQQPKDAMEL